MSNADNDDHNDNESGAPPARREVSLGRGQNFLQGTLDLLILQALASGPKYGWLIAQRIRQISGEVLEVNQGSLYPSLHRLEQQGWIGAEWGISESQRRVKFYSLTAAGRRQLQRERSSWRSFAEAVERVLASGEAAPEGAGGAA